MCIRDRAGNVSEPYPFIIDHIDKHSPVIDSVEWDKAVSYTHLDVYKRQILYDIIVYKKSPAGAPAQFFGVLRVRRIARRAACMVE